MKDDDCAEMQLLVQADVDGELSPREAAAVAAHLDHCAACAELQTQLIVLSGRIRQEVPYHKAPDSLRAAILSRVAAPAKSTNDNPVPRWRRLLRPGLGPIIPFGGGAAVAACLALLLLVPSAGGLPEAVVSDHIRALQPGHLMDVISTDQHTVKPWFDGRLDFAPPVKDFKAEGFPLAGGRLDYLAERPVAALIYQRRQHLIDLYVWPDDGRRDRGPASGSRSGYNFVHWSEGGMSFWAVSDLGAGELADFARLWRAPEPESPGVSR
nr:anti-sigma factor [uncultured Rhodopila sp.]